MIIVALLFLLDNVFNVISIGNRANDVEVLAMRNIPTQDIKLEDIPYMVSVHNYFGQKEKICTGFFIHSIWIMSAAHCFEGGVKKTLITFSSDYDDPSTENRIEPLEIYIHPKYRSKTRSNDLVLIKVQIPISLRSHFQILKIDEEVFKWTRTYNQKLTCIAVGFGKNTTNYSILLVNSYSIRYDGEACSCTGNVPRYLCGTINDVPETCMSDRGGPLICDGLVVGVANKVIECDPSGKKTCGEKTNYRFTYLCAYFPWINTYVNVYTECSGYMEGLLSSTYRVGPASHMILVFVFIVSIF